MQNKAVDLHRLTSRSPLVVAHGLQCDTSYAAMLMKALPKDWRTMGLAGVGLRGDRPPLTSIEEMARHFVSKVQDHYRTQSYILAGFCAGGHISIEMAKQIKALGGEVEHIYLLDTPRAMPSEYYRTLADQQIAIAERRLIMYPESRRYFQGGPETVSAFVDALSRYAQPKINCPTTVLATAEMMPLITDKELGWPGYLGDDTKYVVISPTRDLFTSSGVTLVADYLVASHPPPQRVGEE